MRINPRQKELAVFWGLCLLVGSGWLVGLVDPPLSHPLVHLGLQSTLLAGVFALLGRRRFAGLQWLGIASWGSVLVLPAVVSAGAGVALPPVTLVLVFTLVPVITVLVESHTAARFGPNDSPLELLLPALGGVGGAALLLPFNLPQGTEEWRWLGAAVGAAMLTGLALVRLRLLLRDAAVASAACTVSAGWAAVCLCLGWLGQQRGMAVSVPRMIALDLQQAAIAGGMIWLILTLLRKWTAGRFSARYLAAPLVTVLEGLALLRPPIGWTLCAGTVLLGIAVGMLLRAKAADYADAMWE